jgi:hypothetical protein
MGRTIVRFDWTAASASRGVIRVVATRSAIMIVILLLVPMKKGTCKRCHDSHVYFCLSGKGKVTHQDAIRRASSASRINDVVAGRWFRMSEPS